MQYMDPHHQHHHQSPPSHPQPQQPHLPPLTAQAPPASPMSQQLPVMPQPQQPAQMQPYGGVPPATPNLVPVPVANHPPYAQMITEAIVALNEREGSSKRAIGKFIEQQYSTANLPAATHSVLLTSHLKKLKEQGIIVMVKHSYALPNTIARSAPAAPTPSSNGAFKRRGRPPKPKTPAPASAQPYQAPEPSPLPAATVTQHDVFASLGLSDGPVHIPVVEGSASSGGVKRGRGRPKKAAGSGAPPALQPKGIIGKKSPGRPRKVAAKNASNSAAPGAGPVAGASQQPRLKLDGTPAKPRGRPPKRSGSNVPAQDASAPAVTGGFLAPAVYVGEGAIDPAATPASLPKRRGRPSLKAQNTQNGPQAQTAQNGPKMPRKLSGKPLGRPRKIASPGGVQGPSGQQQGPAYDEIRSQLDYLQSKVRESVSILKPCLEGNAGLPGAANALRELEELGNVALGGPAAGAPVQQPPQQSWSQL